MKKLEAGQLVNVACHATACVFVRYLPLVTWTTKAKPRAVVTFGVGGGEMEVYVDEITAIDSPDAGTMVYVGMNNGSIKERDRLIGELHTYREAIEDRMTNGLTFHGLDILLQTEAEILASLTMVMQTSKVALKPAALLWSEANQPKSGPAPVGLVEQGDGWATFSGVIL